MAIILHRSPHTPFESESIAHYIKPDIPSVSSGWVLNLRSGVQVCYFEPAIALQKDKSFPKDLNFSVAEMLDMVAPERPSPSLAPWIGGLGNGKMPPAVRTSTLTPPPDVIYGEPRKRRNWASKEGLDFVRCKRIIGNMFVPDYYAAITGYTPKIPFGVSLGNGCCVAIFLTSPPKELQIGGPIPRAPGYDINFQHESWLLAWNTMQVDGSGGYIDLMNSLQIAIYAETYLNPMAICRGQIAMSLKECLDQRVVYREAYHEGKQQTASADTAAASVNVSCGR